MSRNSLFSNQPMHVPTDLNWNELKNVERFTSGGSSLIYKAVFNEAPVIVKTIKPDIEDINAVAQEIEKEMVILSKLNHPNIVKLYAAGFDIQGRRFLVLEHLDGGTLKQMISSRKGILSRISCKTFRNKLYIRDALRDAHAIAKAMEYCHTGFDEYMILHRDLKPDNIGYKSDGTLKIMDFGLATVIDRKTNHPNELYKMSGAGSPRYMATEVAKNLPYNHKADIYSFGIILYELLSCNKAFSGIDIDEYYRKVVYGGHRPVLSNKWPDELNKLMQKCWNIDIDVRPSFSEVVSAVKLTSGDLSNKTATPKNVSLKIIRSSIPKKIRRKQIIAKLA